MLNIVAFKVFGSKVINIIVSPLKEAFSAKPSTSESTPKSKIVKGLFKSTLAVKASSNCDFSYSFPYS